MNNGIQTSFLFIHLTLKIRQWIFLLHFHGNSTDNNANIYSSPSDGKSLFFVSSGSWFCVVLMLQTVCCGIFFYGDFFWLKRKFLWLFCRQNWIFSLIKMICNENWSFNKLLKFKYLKRKEVKRKKLKRVTKLLKFLFSFN